MSEILNLNFSVEIFAKITSYIHKTITHLFSNSRNVFSVTNYELLPSYRTEMTKWLHLNISSRLNGLHDLLIHAG